MTNSICASGPTPNRAPNQGKFPFVTRLPVVYPIVNVDLQDEPKKFLEKLFLEGAQLVQLRNKKFSTQQFSDLAREIIAARDVYFQQHPQEERCAIIINDSVSICKAVGADGVHLGQTDGSPEDARQLLGPDAIIGLSTHHEAHIQSAPLEALSYLALGPIFHSITKSGHAEPIGTERLRQIVAELSLPLVAIGGISEENAPDVLAAGASSVAMISAISKKPSLLRTLTFSKR